MTTHGLNSDVVYVGVGGGPAFGGAPTAWANYSPAGTGWTQASYYKDPAGTVHVRGLVTLGTANTPIFTLPLGFRPVLQEIFALLLNGTTPVRCDIANNGNIVPGTAAGAGGFLSLAGISFLAEL